MASEQSEVHIIKMTVFLKKVNITVRFPCSISFALKNEQYIVEHHNIHELKKGQCVINQSLDIQLEIVKRKGVYQDKKISLQISMISVNGKIPAGSVTINATDKIMTQKRAPLQKCPDKNAEVIFTQNCEFVEVVKKISNPPNLMAINLSSPTGQNTELSRSRLQYSASTKLMSPHQMQIQHKDTPEVEFRPEGRLYNNKHQHSSKDLRLSAADQTGSQKRGRLGLLKINDMAKNCLSGSNLDQNSEKGSHYESQIFESNVQMNARQSRLSMLERSKDSYLKKLNKFRHSVARVDSEQQLDFNDEFERSRFQNQLEQSQLMAYSGQGRRRDRRDTHTSSQVRDLRDQLDKRRSRIIQLDSSRVQIESQLGEKDKLIAQIQQEKKKLQEQLDSEKISVASSQKRLEMKEQSYKDQLKKINEKYAQSESERQKAVIDYNNLLATIESNELKSQYALRDKERSMSQEKMRLNKKIDQLAGQLTTAYEKIAEWKAKISQLEEAQKRAANKEQEHQTRMIKLMEENKDLLYELRVSQDNSKRLADEREREQYSVYEDKNNYKRKYNQAMNGINEYRDKYERIARNQLMYESKINDLQSKLERQTRERQSLNSRIEQYRRKQMRREQDEEIKQRMSETLSVQNQNQNHKVSQLKHRLEAERQRYEDLEEKCDEKIRFVLNQKQMLENDLDEAKWRLDRQLEKVETLNKRNRQLSEQVMDLSQKVMVFEEKELLNNEQLQTKNKEIKQLSSQVANLDDKMNYIRQNLKGKDDGFYELQKITEDYCRQIEGLKMHIRDLTNTVADKEQQIRRTEGKWKIQIMDKLNAVTNLGYELDISKEVINKLKAEIDAKNKQIHQGKQAEKRIAKDLSALKAKMEDFINEDKEKEEKIQMLQNYSQQEKVNIKSIERQLQRKQSQLDDYKYRTVQALQQLFSILSRQDADLKKEDTMLLALPDEILAEKQMETIKKHNNLIDQLQEQVKVLNNSVKYFQTEILRQQQYIEALQEDHAQLIKKQQEKYKLLTIEHFQQICSMKKKIDELNDSPKKQRQVDHLNGEIMRYESIIGELEESVAKRDKQLSELKTNLNVLDKQLFSYKEKEIKDKLLSNSQAEEIKQLLMLEQDRNRMLIDKHKDELKAKDRVVAEKNEELKRYIFREEQYRLKEDKFIGELKDNAVKIDDFTKDMQSLVNQIKQKDQKISKLENDINNSKAKKEQMKLKYMNFEQEIKRHKFDSQQFQSQLAKMKEQLENQLQDAVQQQRKEGQRRQRAESVKEKLEEECRLLKEKCIKLESEMSFHTFYKLETTKKLEQYETYRQETTNELKKWRDSAVKNQKQASQHQNQYFKYQVEIESLLREKEIIIKQNNQLRDKICQLDQTLTAYQSSQSELNGKDKQIQRLTQLLQCYDEQTEKITAELKANLNKTKEALAEKQNKIKELEKFVEDRYNDLGLEKLRWEKQSENEKNDMQIRMAQMEDKYQMIQDQYQFQKLQAIRQVQSANGVIQQLNEVVRDKEDQITQKEDIINEQNVRIEELTVQLNECIHKWETQKETYLPTEAKMAQIDQQLVRMNKFINDLDGRNKQLLEINKRRMQTKVESGTSITQLLKEIYGMMLKHKNKILNRCQSEKEKQAVIKEFKGVQEKLDMTLKSTQIVTVKQ